MSTASLILSLGSNDFPLTATELKIGRDPQNEVVLADESVSVFHSVFAPSPHGVVLKDLDTTNGTFVNGRRIKETFIEVGDQIRFGNVEAKIAAPQQPAVKDVLCPHCGADVAAESKFCIACGIAMVNQPEEVVEKDTVKPAFSWWPSNQLGASVLTALFVLIFSGCTYEPIGTVLLLAFGYAVSTAVRYVYHRLRSPKKDQSSASQNVPTALWKRWPVRTALLCLALNVCLLDYESYSQRELVLEHSAEIRSLEETARENGVNIDNLRQQNPLQALMDVAKRGGNPLEGADWKPETPEQRYFQLALLKEGAIKSKESAHSGTLVIGVVLLILAAFVAGDGYIQSRREGSTFTLWPQSQLGASLAMVVVINSIPGICFTRSFYDLFTTVSIVFLVVTGARYLLHRILKAMDRLPKEPPSMPEALWRRWHIRTSFVMLAFVAWTCMLSAEGHSQSAMQMRSALEKVKSQSAIDPNFSPGSASDSIEMFKGTNISTAEATNRLSMMISGQSTQLKNDQMSLYVCAVAFLALFGLVIHDALTPKTGRERMEPKTP